MECRWITSLLLDLRRNAVKADDIKTGELSATSTSTYILKEKCAQTMYKQTKQWRDKT